MGVLSDVSPFFTPRSIAVIGASDDPTKIGGRPIRNLLLGGYEGRILPINPRYQRVQGLEAFAAIGDVGEPVDLAIVSLPALAVPDAIAACAASGVKAAIVFSAGFSEASAEGEEAQRRIEASARSSGLRLLGPNCMGTINTRAGVLATFTSGIVEAAPEPGRISLASQSGAFGSHCLALMRERGLALNLWATTGNQCDVEVSDFLAYMAADPDTDVVIGSIESVRDAGRLIEAFDIAQRNKKPMIVMKVGTSDAGAAAMASHTASLAGSDAVFDAVARRYGVYRATSIDELMDVAYACSRGRLPDNDRLGIVTVSGGVGVLMADAAAELDVALPELPDATQDDLRTLVPFAGTRNPVDVTAQILNDPDLIEPMLTLLLEEGNYASVIIFLSHLGLNPQIIAKLMPGLKRVSARFPDRYLSVSLLAHGDVRAELEAGGYIVFEDPNRAVRAASALARFGASFGKAQRAVLPLPAPAPARRGESYTETEGKQMLAAAGIPVTNEEIVVSAEAAALAAARIGFPVVLKIVSPDIAHKSDVGGVMLNLADDAAVRDGYTAIIERVSSALPNARIDGVLVAAMIPRGLETVLGVVKDPIFGPVVMFGLGGIFVEVLRDVVFRPAPFGVEEAREMIAQVRGRAMFEGVRGAPPADVDALADALSKLSLFAAANVDTIASVDINPFLVLPSGEGAIAVDAFIETVAAQAAPQEGGRP
ncbi:Acetyl-CoA synthetase (ADP-forming) [Novosphingobium resinovorum]|uniref:Acetyl-CoA synthetase (ADP-forming) n=2 Tax=Novosphingobium resinovorum TaxID=158500 RepID=A0A031JR24_9SPHN|nr:Acetyl-CoA synthetase (ADP-forming) [Novosphingobium resinovorum]